MIKLFLYPFNNVHRQMEELRHNQDRIEERQKRMDTDLELIRKSLHGVRPDDMSAGV